MTVFLEARKLSLWRGGKWLFSELDLALESGLMLWVEGANGSGKSSLLETLCGLRQAETGTLWWHGARLQDWQILHRHCLYIGHRHGHKPLLTARQNLALDVALSDASNSISALLRQIGLAAVADKAVRQLSAGQQKRLSLSRLWLSPSPPLWLLDEPFNALDEDGAQLLWQRLQEHLQNGGTVALSAHRMAPLQALHSRRLRLGQGNAHAIIPPF